MGKYIREKKKSAYQITSVFLGLYFITLPFDFIRIGDMGSICKLLAIAPMLCLLLHLQKTSKLKLNMLFVWLTLFLGAACLSYTYTISEEKTLAHITSLLLNVLMILAMSTLVGFSEKEIRFLKTCLVIGSWVAVVFVLFFGITPYGRATIAVGEYEQDQNYLCGYMFFAFIYHFERFIDGKKPGHLLLAIGIMSAVIMTGSRGALLAFFVCIIVEIFAVSKKNHHAFRTMTISMLGLAVLYLLIVYLVIPNLDSTIAERFSLEYLAEEGTTGRIEIWDHLMKKFQESSLLRKLFGNGYGTTTLVNERNHKVAHNLYIDTLTTLGVVGVVYLLGIQITTIRTAYKNKEMLLLCTMIGFIIMCMSMSLVSYKPMWATIMMIMITNNNGSKKNEL